MKFHLTVRWGHPSTRYHQDTLDAPDLRAALVQAAEALPEEVVSTADLAEIRPAQSPEDREYLEG